MARTRHRRWLYNRNPNVPRGLADAEDGEEGHARQGHPQLRRQAEKDDGAGEKRPGAPSCEACANHDERRPAVT